MYSRIAGWSQPGSAGKAATVISPELRPLLQECNAMYSLLLPHALKPPLPAVPHAPAFQSLLQASRAQVQHPERRQPGNAVARGVLNAPHGHP
jgi:hypothetical protein